MTKCGRASDIRRVRRIAFGIPRRIEQTFFSIANYRNTVDYAYILWDVYTYVKVLQLSVD